MKKLIALILCVLLVAALGITAFAAEGTKITVTPSAKEVQRGDKVTVTVSISGDNQLTSMGYRLVANSKYFTSGRVSTQKNVLDAIYEPGDPLQLTITPTGIDVANWPDYTATPNEWGDYPAGPVLLKGDLCYFELTIKDDAPFGKFNVTDVVSIKNGSDTVAFELIDAEIEVVCTEHKYGAWTEDGDKHTKTCSECGNVQEADHAWDAGKVTTEPTCAAKGVKTFTCADCKATKTEEVAKTTDHKYGAWTAAGDEHTKTCSVCGDVQKAAHAWDAGKVTTAATCTAKGVKTFTCADCKTTKTADVDMIDHAWDEGKVTTEPTCTAEGVKTYTCTSCKTETKTEKIDMIPHEAEKWEKVDEKTHKGTCSVCSQEVTVDHVYEEKITKEATCKEDGEKTLTCSCGEVVTEKIAKTTDHKWDEGKVTTAATAEKEGVKTYTCSVCGETKTEAVAKLPASSNTDTGDNTMMIPLMILVVLSGFGLALTVIGKKKFAR